MTEERTLLASQNSDAECRRLLEAMRRGDWLEVEKSLIELDRVYHYAGSAPTWRGFHNLTHCFRLLLTAHLHGAKTPFTNVVAIEDAKDYNPANPFQTAVVRHVGDLPVYNARFVKWSKLDREAIAALLQSTPPEGANACDGTRANCFRCGYEMMKAGATCPRCLVQRTHRDCYPEQYEHPLCGVRVLHGGCLRTIYTIRPQNRQYVATFTSSAPDDPSVPISELQLPEVPDERTSDTPV